MESKSLVLYDRNDEDIIRNDETVTYENPLEGILNRTIEKQNTCTDPVRKTNSIESYKVCDKHKDTIQSINDTKDTSFAVDKENISTQLLDEYKYCKDVISYITSKNSLNNSENTDSAKSLYRNVNDVFVFTITKDNDIASCPKMSETTSDDSQKPCVFLKPCDDPKPCDAQKPSDTSKPCDSPKPCNAQKSCDIPKPCDTPKPCDKESNPKITCSTKKSSHCNEKSPDDSNKCYKESCKSPISQLSDCILKCLETEKSESSSYSKTDAAEDNAPCLHKNVVDSAEVKPCPNKSSSISSFQNFIESSATTLTTFKTSFQDFIGTVCDKTKEAAKLITDEGLKVLGLKEKPCSDKNCKECNPGCSKAKKCDFNSNNDSNNEEVKITSHICEDVSCKSNVHGLLESIVASKLEKSSKYDVPKVDEAGMSITSLLGSIKDRVVSFIYPLGDSNQNDENNENNIEKREMDKACRPDAISPCQIINIDNEANEGKYFEACHKEDPTTETIDEIKCKTNEDEHFEL